jgi:hypothetical protein
MSLMGWNKETLYTDYAVLAPTHLDPCVDVAFRSGLEIDPLTGGVVVRRLRDGVVHRKEDRFHDQKSMVRGQALHRTSW